MFQHIDFKKLSICVDQWNIWKTSIYKRLCISEMFEELLLKCKFNSIFF